MDTTDTKQDFLHWYEPIHPALTRYCSSRAWGLMETEDLVQEAVLATLQNFSRVRDKEKLLGFMIGVVNNVIKNKLRRHKFRGAWDEQRMADLESKLGDPELLLDIQYLHKAIEQLPARQREALTLFEISGFSIREISVIQQSTEAATKMRLSRARKALRELLDDTKSTMSLSQRLAVYASVLF
ncbi:MAG: RNA polymerase sigma factor [Saprospiraceae bacterium]